MSKSGTKTGLFLMELVIALLLFAFCAAICMQLFVAARSRTRDSDNLSQSVYIVTSAAECYKNSGGDLEAVRALLGGEIDGGNTLIVNYDAKWEIPSGDKTAGETSFELIIEDANSGTAEISVIQTKAVIFDGELTSTIVKDIYSITVKAVSNVA